MSRADLLNAQAEALECPFCGNKPRVVNLSGWEVLCDCGACMCLFDDSSRDAVVTTWNKRAQATACDTPKNAQFGSNGGKDV